jgi:hypothetical protein
MADLPRRNALPVIGRESFIRGRGEITDVESRLRDFLVDAPKVKRRRR